MRRSLQDHQCVQVLLTSDAEKNLLVGHIRRQSTLPRRIDTESFVWSISGVLGKLSGLEVCTTCLQRTICRFDPLVLGWPPVIVFCEQTWRFAYHQGLP
jgi:hypothetical protein